MVKAVDQFAHAEHERANTGHGHGVHVEVLYQCFLPKRSESVPVIRGAGTVMKGLPDVLGRAGMAGAGVTRREPA